MRLPHRSSNRRRRLLNQHQAKRILPGWFSQVLGKRKGKAQVAFCPCGTHRSSWFTKPTDESVRRGGPACRLRLAGCEAQEVFQIASDTTSCHSDTPTAKDGKLKHPSNHKLNRRDLRIQSTKENAALRRRSARRAPHTQLVPTSQLFAEPAYRAV
jgi:hypothetical protein